MKRAHFSWKVGFALFLVGISAALHLLHYLIFRDAHHIFLYLLGDIAFVPISVLLVTLVLEHILESKQKEARMHKLNMVVDAFFSEIGNPLLKKFQVYLKDNPAIAACGDTQPNWTRLDFDKRTSELRRSSFVTNARLIDLESLKTMLSEKRIFLLSLLESPTLLEHDKITDMLWAVSHLTEELIARKNLKGLAPRDIEHLSADIKRAYEQLIFTWFDHIKHLQEDYPYLFSLAVRLNPFNPSAHAEIT